MKANRRHFGTLGVYTVLSLLLSWPLLRQITTHVPGIAQWAFDESTFIWNIWYFKQALVDQLRSPLHTELIWYPLGIDLVLYTYNVYHALVAQPLALAVNLPFGSNVVLLMSTVLSGYGTFLLVSYLLWRQEPTPERSHLGFTAAVVAGLLYAFASNRSIYAALGHYDMVTTQWIPFYALMLLRSLDGALTPQRRRKAALLAGLFLALTGLAEMISALFLAIFTVIVVIGWLTRRQERARRLADLRLVSVALLLTGIVAFALWSPVLLPILYQFLTDDFSLEGWGEAIPLSTDLLGWFTPTVLHPLWGGDLIAELRRVQLRALAEDGVGFRDVNTVFLGWASLVLALVGAWRYGRQIALWLWTSAIFGLFTLGPFLQINGRYQFDLDGIPATFPLPYALLHYLPIIKANRAPNRNSVLLMLGVAVLAGYGLYWLLRWLDRKRSTGHLTPAQSLGAVAIAGLILFEHLAVPAPLSDARIPAVYETIAADPRPVSVLQVPLGWRNSFGVFGAEKTLLQYYQTAHGKPMLGGNISRAPEFKLAYFQRIPYFQALTNIEFGHPVDPAVLTAAQAQADELVYLYNVGYVLLFPAVPQRFPYADHWPATWNFVKATLPLETEPFWTGDGIEAYRVVPPTGGDTFTLHLGDGDTFPYRGEGWDGAATDTIYDTPAIWATAQEGRLFLPLRQVDDTATYGVTLRLRPFVYPGSPPQTVTLIVNNQAVDTQTLTGDWQEVRWALSGAWLIDGLNRLTLRWGYAQSPRAVLPGNRLIGNTGVELPIDADLKGFADGGFIALFDDAGEQVDASAGRRGVNVTVLDRNDGTVLAQAGFDTTANVYESAALAAFVRQIAPGTPVLVVSHGDATTHLTDEAVTALRALGADVTLDELQGQHFALIGVQGAIPGTALTVSDPTEAFVRLSLERDRRTLAAAVDWVQVARE
jgi:hypothetical protein